MTDINEIPSGRPQPPQPLPPSDALIETIEVKKIDSPDAMGYGTDTMSSAASITVLQFAPKSIYEASIHIPELLPPDPEGVTGPQPYGTAEQRLIRQKIAKEMAERMKKEGILPADQKAIYDALLSGKPIQDPKLGKVADKIKKEVTETIQKEARLPTSWTLQSTAAKEWIPVPVEPYNEAKRKEIDAAYDTNFETALETYSANNSLSVEVKEKIKTAFATGKVGSDIGEHFEAVSKIASEEVQKNYGLPNTWYKGTTNVEDLKPIYLGIVTPVTVNSANGQMILGNVEQLSIALGKAIEKVVKQLPADDPNQLNMADYQTVIASALRELKAILREIQVKDAEKAKETQIARLDLTEQRKKAVDEEFAAQKEAKAKQEKASFTGFIMKIIGPIIAALATIVGAVLSVFTFGASTALIVAGVVVGVALTAYSVADSITGCTGKLIEAFNAWLVERFPDNEFLQKLVKALIIVAVVVVLIIATVFSGGGAAASAATQTAAQVARQVVVESIKQLSLQLIVMTIMSSNVIPELIVAIAKKNGMSEEDAKWLEMAVMIAVAVVAMAAAAKMGGGKGVEAATKTGAAASVGVVATVQNIGNKILAAARNLIEQIQKGAEEAVRALIKLLNDLIRQLASFAAQIPGALKGAFDEIVSAARTLLKAIGEGRTIELISQGISRFAEALQSFAKLVKELTEDALTKVIQEALDILNKIGGKVKETGSNIAEGFREIGRNLRKFPELLVIRREYVNLKNMDLANIKMSADQLKRFKMLEEFMTNHGMEKQISSIGTGISKTLQLTSGAIELADGIAQGVMGIQIYQLLLEVGETKKAEELLQAIIDQLNKLLQSFSDGLDANAEALKGVNDFLTNFWAGQSEVVSKFARAGHA